MFILESPLFLSYAEHTLLVSERVDQRVLGGTPPPVKNVGSKVKIKGPCQEGGL
jgi:hypothetical protein